MTVQSATSTATPGAVRAVERASLSLSGSWQFAVDADNVGEKQGWVDPTFDATSWQTVEVPHTWGVMPAYSTYDGVAWYRRVVAVPASARDAHLRLRFDAVFYLAKVWLNGQYLGEHEGGYTPFEFDVTGIARPGQDNTIAVRVDNSRASNRIPANLSLSWSYDWWNYGGIVRDVSLELTSRAYIARQKIVAVPHLTGWNEADTAQVAVTVTLSNTSDQAIEGSLAADVFREGSSQSALAAPAETHIRVPPRASLDVELTAQINAPALWHFDDPNLYRWSATFATNNGLVLDHAEDTFGVRLIELKDARFTLNGEPLRLVGLTRHADSPGNGLAETVTAMTADYDDLKRLNVVFSRPVHYPQADTILDYCDRNGILLIPEVPAWQLGAFQMGLPKMQDLAKQQLTEMIAEDFNHPSVWAWSVGNEIDSTSPQGHDYVRQMMETAKAADATRPVSFASNRLYSNPQDDAASLADFVLMNQYFGTWGGKKGQLSDALDAIHAAWPDKVVIISEFGFEPGWNRFGGPPTASLSPDNFYFIPDDVSRTGEAADLQRQMVIRDQMAIYRTKPFIAGAIFWTYQDYRSATEFSMGVVDANRNRRGSWQVLRGEYSPALLDGVKITRGSGDQRLAQVKLHARGPVDIEMPAYTLRGYTLHWEVKSPDGAQTFSEGTITLPQLAPGETWSGSIYWPEPGQDSVLTITVIRPTGFAVLEQTFEVAKP